MIQIVSQHGKINYNINKYVVDKIEELEYISSQAAMGSSAFVLENKQTYIKNGEGKWIENSEVSNSNCPIYPIAEEWLL